MAIVQVLFAAASKQASKLLNTAFGWATTMLFGKVPADRQIYLSLISFGSVIWLVALLGVAFPRVGTFLLTFVTLPSWVQPLWIRLVMLACVVLIPAAVGFLSTKLESEKTDQRREGLLKTVLRGYPSTVGLALTLVMLTVFAPIMQARRMLKRWSSAHVPVIVEGPEYATVVDEVQDALARDGMKTRRQQASWMIRIPTRLLTALAGNTVHNLVADQLTVLVSDSLEVLLHPADLVISGKQAEVDSARAVLAERMMFADANLTWTKEANDVEDRLDALWDELNTAPQDQALVVGPRRLAAIEDDLRKAKLSYDEWQVLHRAVMAMDRALLAMAAGAVEHPQEIFDTPHRPISLRLESQSQANERGLVRVLTAAAVAGMTLLQRKTPEGREMIGNRDLINVARLGMQASSDRKAS